MSSRYQVKWTDKNKTVRYGIYVDRTDFSRKDYKGIPKEYVLVEDAVLPVTYALPETALTDVPLTFDCDGEYERYINDAYTKAHKISNTIKRGIQPGSLFSINVADGCAYYVVTKVSGSTCDVEWRGYGGGDRYTDHYFGWGRKRVLLTDVRRYVEFGRSMSKLFKSKKK